MFAKKGPYLGLGILVSIFAMATLLPPAVDVEVSGAVGQLTYSFSGVDLVPLAFSCLAVIIAGILAMTISHGRVTRVIIVILWLAALVADMCLVKVLIDPSRVVESLVYRQFQIRGVDIVSNFTGWPLVCCILTVIVLAWSIGAWFLSSRWRTSHKYAQTPSTQSPHTSRFVSKSKSSSGLVNTTDGNHDKEAEPDELIDTVATWDSLTDGYDPTSNVPR